MVDSLGLVEEYEDCVLSPTLTGIVDLSGNPLDWPLEDRPFIYIAGYFSANPMHGTKNAIKWARVLLDAGWLPLVPHTSIIFDMVAPQTPEFWYAYDLGLLQRCDALFVCPDELTKESVGVCDEIAYAVRHEIPVFYTVVQAKDRYAR